MLDQTQKEAETGGVMECPNCSVVGSHLFDCPIGISEIKKERDAAKIEVERLTKIIGDFACDRWQAHDLAIHYNQAKAVLMMAWKADRILLEKERNNLKAQHINCESDLSLLRGALKILKTKLADSRTQLKLEEKDTAVFGHFAEKFGNLSTCYDAEDLTAVIQRAFDEQKDKLAECQASAAAMREALEFSKDGRFLHDEKCTCYNCAALSSSAGRELLEELEYLREDAEKYRSLEK